MSEEKSPLSEADPVISMQEIMSMDPEDMTRVHRDGIVRVLRAARFEFAQKEAQPKAKRAKALPKPNLKLEDIGL